MAKMNFTTGDMPPDMLNAFQAMENYSPETVRLLLVDRILLDGIIKSVREFDPVTNEEGLVHVFTKLAAEKFR